LVHVACVLWQQPEHTAVEIVKTCDCLKFEFSKWLGATAVSHFKGSQEISTPFVSRGESKGGSSAEATLDDNLQGKS
jgi:hypothetical protein